MGIKTYKCMNDSKIVAGIIAILELGHIAFVILDAITMRGARRLAGKGHYHVQDITLKALIRRLLTCE
jgi:hypothetical protein